MRARRPVLTVFVVVATVLAGCNAPVGGERGTYDVPPTTVEMETRTITPTPTPTSTSTPESPRATGEERLPGLTDAGVTDAGELARAHALSLSNRSFRVTYERRVDTDDGTLRRERFTAVTAANRSRFHVRFETVVNGRTVSKTAYFSTRTGPAYRLVDTGDGPTYEVVSNGSSSESASTLSASIPVDPTLAGYLGRHLFVAANATVTRVEREDGVGYSVLADDLGWAFGSDPERVTNDSLRVVLDENGRVERLRLDYELAQLEVPRVLTVAETVTFDRVNRATVSTPTWLPTARAAVAGGTETRTDPDTNETATTNRTDDVGRPVRP